MHRATVLILVLCATILVNEVTTYVVLPPISKTAQNALEARAEKNVTSKNGKSDDYNKYSYIITTYL